MTEVKRYEAVHIRYEENNIRYGEGCEVEVVTARDYDALEAECERLRNTLLEVTARHFAESWNKRASDKELEQYLSAGIAQLEEERDTLRTANLRIEGENKRLREALTDLLGCPTSVVQTTVPKAGIEAAPPYQVVLDVSVSLTRWKKAEAALAGDGGDV